MTKEWMNQITVNLTNIYTRVTGIFLINFQNFLEGSKLDDLEVKKGRKIPTNI